jgi:hypothetical protein
MKRIVCASLAALVSACATSPNNISAQYVSPLQYANYSCDQLIQETRRIGDRVSQVTGQQQKKANDDALAMGVGLVLFWPALFFLAGGNDKKEELGRLKGEYDAIQQAAIQKNCMAQQQQQAVQPASVAAPAAAPAPAAPAKP